MRLPCSYGDWVDSLQWRFFAGACRQEKSLDRTRRHNGAVHREW